MTDFKKAFYGLNKTKANELNTVISELDTFHETIDDYVTDTELTDYVTTTALNTALGSYVTSTSLTTTLGDYEKTADLTTLLAGYVVDADITNFATIVAAPASATATGTAGTIAYDATHIYVCIATDTWVRADLATWT